MSTYIKTEILKNRHSSTEKMIVFLPVFFTIFSAGLSLLMFGGQRSDYFIAVAYNWFPVTFLPMIIALFASQENEREKKNHCEDYYQSLNVSLIKIWVSKIIVIAINLGIMMLFNFILTVILEKIFLHESINIIRLIAASFVIYIGSLSLIPISLLLSRVTNTFVTVLVNFIMSFVGVSLAAEKSWIICPWSWSTRMTAPILGIHPNGQFLESSNALLSTHVIGTGLLIACISFFMMSFISTKIYQKKIERRE